MNRERSAEELTRLFFRDELTEEEKEWFVKKISKDEDFAEKVAEEVVREHGRIALKKELKSILEKPSGGKIRPLGIQRFMRIAAVVLLLILPLGYLGYRLLSPPDIYATYFEPYRSTVISRAGTAEPSLWEKAMGFYAGGKYNRALEILNQNSSDIAPEDYLYHFYTGLSFLASDPPLSNDAITHFKTVLQSENEFHEQAKWYLALAYMENDQKSEAKPLLKQLSSNADGFKSKEAGNILDTVFN